MTHTLPPQGGDDGVSIVQPPFHYHIYQNEFFQLQKGTAVIFKGVDPKPFAILSEDGQKTATIPAGRYHRFENQSSTEELVIDIHLSPESYENEVMFFRNFFGYLDDCKQAKTAPSFFQLMVFLHSADTPLAVPAPWEMLGKVLSRILLTGAALWGNVVLGYKSSYLEYYEPKKAR
jgi:mannose-6-phosphate isomerase-like protein (cupin superfamily)